MSFDRMLHDIGRRSAGYEKVTHAFSPYRSAEVSQAFCSKHVCFRHARFGERWGVMPNTGDIDTNPIEPGTRRVAVVFGPLHYVCLIRRAKARFHRDKLGGVCAIRTRAGYRRRVSSKANRGADAAPLAWIVFGDGQRTPEPNRLRCVVDVGGDDALPCTRLASEVGFGTVSAVGEDRS